MLTRRAMVGRLFGGSLILFLEGCDFIADLPTGPAYFVAPLATGTTYYLDPGGDDANRGTDPGEAWRTLGRLAGVKLEPGDQVLLKGGAAFAGPLLIDGARVSGTEEKPIRFGSYGAGRATIRRAGSSHGIHLLNADHILVENLKVDGLGRTLNSSTGVFVQAKDTLHRGVTLRDLEVYGWGEKGVFVRANAWAAPDAGGWENIVIERVHVHNCRGDVGLSVWGENGDFESIRGVTIRDCKVEDIIGTGWQWTGSGILLFWTSDFLVEYCEISHTGAQSGRQGGGPIGLWTSGVRRGTIRHCESHHNTAAGKLDGGGFDLDDASQEVTIEYCYSHDNKGPAFLFASWNASAGRESYGNVIRYCVSENDGRSNHAVVSIYRESDLSPATLRDCQLYGNTFVVTAPADGTPLVWCRRPVQNFSICNNIFVTAGSRRMLRVQQRTSGLSFAGNAWHAPDGTWEVDWAGTVYGGLEQWRAGTSQERLGNRDTGTDADPLLESPGRGGSIGDPRNLASLSAYKLRAGSPMPTAGVDLRGVGVQLPAHDFYGVAIPASGAFLAAGAASTSAVAAEPPRSGALTYYLDPGGDDANRGTDPGEAWRTLGRLAGVKLEPGDQVLLKGGAAFAGPLLIDGARVSGTEEKPIRFGSYGAGRATIRRAGSSHGIHLLNADHILVENLKVDGLGRTLNSSTGVYVQAKDMLHRRVTLRDLEVYGWGEKGLLVQGSAPGRWENILIERVQVRNCRGEVGLAVWGEDGDFESIRGVTIRDCKVEDIIGTGWQWTGTGMVLSSTTDFRVEHCEITRTGAESGSTGRGPVGLATSGVRRGTIRHCESHHNTAAGKLDGGGFDLDDATQEVTIEYCYSHDNKGPAFLFAKRDARAGRESYGNVIRYCVSENDGRSNHAVVSIYRDRFPAPATLRDCQLYGNTFVVTAPGGGTPLVWCQREVQNFSICNNIFVTAGSRRMLRVQTLAPGLVFAGNAWHAPGGTWEADWNGAIYGSLEQWRAGTSQERLGNLDTGTDADPLLESPGRGGSIGDPRNLPSLRAYKLRAGSPMPTAGVDLRGVGVQLPAHDFYGVAIPASSAFLAIGAASTAASSPESRVIQRAAQLVEALT